MAGVATTLAVIEGVLVLVEAQAGEWFAVPRFWRVCVGLTHQKKKIRTLMRIKRYSAKQLRTDVLVCPVKRARGA